MTTRRNVYLDMKSLTDAQQTMCDYFMQTEPLSSETVAVPDAVGRVLAKPVFAALSSPNFHAAAMDGIAVNATVTFGASETKPKELKLGTQAFHVNTGNVLPEGTDAVIMIEHIQAVGENSVRIEAPAFPWQYVRKMGEDIVATELLFPQHHQITPYCIGALLSGGILTVDVKRKPRILIIPTGTELVDWRRSSAFKLKPGQVLESNSYVISKLIDTCGGTYIKHDAVEDDLPKITRTVQSAFENDMDMVLILGGSSAGSKDFSKPVIENLGDVLVHGVTIMPGKPIIIGAVGKKPVFGIPGYPVSAIVAFEQFVQVLMAQMLHQSPKKRPTVDVVPTRKMPSKLGVEEFVRVKLGQVGDRIVATSLPRGSGNITTFTKADGIIRIPEHLEGINAQETVSAELLRPLSAIQNTIVAVGSHDNTLDILADQIMGTHPNTLLSSSHVGSMGGLMAIKKGVCHMAGSHLLDISDGSYNISYIRKYLAGIPVKLVHLVMREQGLIVAPGNPKKITQVSDLCRDDVRFINRQAGSGTRILLDYKLSEQDLSPEAVNGYEHEEFTHMTVAVAVLSGRADAGLGIFAAAKALQLDFIPVVTEQYDLIIPEQFYASANIRILLDVICGSAFKSRVREMGGYSTKRTGELIALQ